MKLKDCKDKIGYQQDCPAKRMLKTIANDHPSGWEITEFNVHEQIPMMDPNNSPSGGRERQIYTKVTVTIELLADLYFDEKKKLRRCR